MYHYRLITGFALINTNFLSFYARTHVCAAALKKSHGTIEKWNCSFLLLALDKCDISLCLCVCVRTQFILLSVPLPFCSHHCQYIFYFILFIFFRSVLLFLIFVIIIHGVVSEWTMKNNKRMVISCCTYRTHIHTRVRNKVRVVR